MRTFITLLLLLGSCLLTSAQTKERGLFIELNGGYGQIDKFYKHDGYGFLAPAIGYQFNSRWAAGIKTRFELGADFNYTTFGAYGQYAFMQKNRIKLFGEAAATSSAVCGGMEGGDNNYSEAGLSVGAAYSLGSHCNLLLRYLHIGYSDARDRNEDFCLGGGKFVVDGNLKRLQVGVQWIF